MVIINLILVICNARFNRQNIILKQRTNKINIITQNRAKWMQQLRELISEYSSYINYIQSILIHSNKDFIKTNRNDFTKIIHNFTSKIKLHLNIIGKPDIEIMEIIEKTNLSISIFFDLYSNSKKDNIELFEFLFNDTVLEREQKLFIIFDYFIKIINSSSDFIELLIGIYLKAEWERVKYESDLKNIKEKKFEEFYNEAKEIVLSEYNNLKESFDENRIDEIINKN